MECLFGSADLNTVIPLGIDDPVHHLNRCASHTGRVSLFLDDAALSEIEEAFSDVEPLWSEEMFFYYDRFGHGDDFSSQEYRQSFRLIALRCPFHKHLFPDHYRLDGMKNVVFQEHCQQDESYALPDANDRKKAASSSLDSLMRQSYDTNPVRLLIHNKRNALERTILHFANYDKDTRQLNKNTWECCIYYDSSMETELLIEILSFGPVVKVTGPDTFVDLIRDRLQKQLALIHGKKQLALIHGST